jgi:hypothetical protein
MLVAVDPRTNRDKWHAAEERFWSLYWSELCMVESTEVEAAMKEFGKALKAYSKVLDETGAVMNPSVTLLTETDREIARAREHLENSAYAAAHAMRASIEKSWGLPEMR